MRRREWITISAAGLTVAISAAADDRVTLRRRLRCVPGLAPRDYQYLDFSPPAAALSASAVSVGPFPAAARLRGSGATAVAFKGPTIVSAGAEAASAEPAAGVRAKKYQFFDPPTIQVGHCSVTEMGAVIDQEGRWIVSLLADQNPVAVAGRSRLIDQVVVDDVRGSVAQTRQILRNRFHVRILGYATEGGGVDPAVGLADPAVFEADVPAFWVQRGEPRRMHWRGRLAPDQAPMAYALVDRVRIEFSYELQPGLRADRP